MDKGKQLAKNSILYAVGNFGSKILTFLIVPLYTFYINTGDMGVYDAIVTAVSLCSPVLVLSIYEGVYRWSIQNVTESGKYIRYGLKFEIRNLLIALCVYILVGQLINIPYFWCTLFYVISVCVHTFISRVTRALGNTGLFAGMGLLYTALYLGFNVLFIVVMNLGVLSFFLSLIIGNSVTSLVMLIVQRSYFVKGFFNDEVSKADKRDIVKYSVAITPNDICWWIVGLSDRFALIWFVSASANGIYSISQKFPTIITMLTSIFYMAWQDQSVASFSDKDKDDYYTKVFNVYSRVLLCCGLCLVPITKYVILFFMETSYRTAWYYCMPLYIGTIFSALASFLGVGYLGAKKTHKALITTIIAAIVNVSINLVFMPLFPEKGIFVASISTMISYVVLFIVRVVQTRVYFKIKYPTSMMLIITLVTIISGVVLYRTNIYVDILIFIASVVTSIIVLRNYIGSLLMIVKKKFNKTPKHEVN